MTRQPRSAIPFPQRLISPVRKFIKDSRATGIVLIACTLISLFLSNSMWSEGYIFFWQREIPMPLPGMHLPHSILHIINDALMAIFFLLAGLEIKRELLVGELAGIKKSLLPIIAALGGMIVPALLYTAWCGQTPFSNGWGIPMATDIAFSLGVLSLLGNRAPLSVRIFLTALAIIDDLGGIVTIALFYAGNINVIYLLYAGITLLGLLTLNLFKIKLPALYVLLGLLLWYFVFNSGVHATIAGVLLAFTIPLRKIAALEATLHGVVHFIIMPLFALANTAIALPAHFASVFSSPIHQGIFTGLFLGKPVGIVSFCFLAVKLKLASLPEGMRWKQLIGTGLVAGIGFTMSIFIATLAFKEEEYQLIAKIAIIGASALAGLVGFIYMRLVDVKKKTATA